MPRVVAPALRSPTTKRNQFGGKCGDRKTTFIAKGASVAQVSVVALLQNGSPNQKGRGGVARGPFVALLQSGSPNQKGGAPRLRRPAQSAHIGLFVIGLGRVLLVT